MDRRIVIAILVIACGRPHRDAPAPTPHPPPAPTASRPAPPHHAPPAKPAGATAFYASTFSKRPAVTDMVLIGEQMFRDPSLSASGKLACASCHDPANAFAPSSAAAVQRGGVTGAMAGVRAAPSLRYLQAIPQFTEHFSGEDGVDQGPAGGLTWDGRVQSLHDQARSPLFSPLEMANTSPKDLVAKLQHVAYVDQIRAAFGPDALATTESAIKAMLWSLEVYQQTESAFYPYTSKYDAVLRGRATLDERELRGQAVFDDRKKGNCASCHPRTAEAGFPAFTDFGFVALGVPRNRDIPKNAEATYFDLGLCGPYRTDLASHPEYCGMFRTPSLRNVARRKRYFHNGVFTSLEQVVRFYVTRDVTPARWYPHEPFDDMPATVRKNVTTEPPFGTHTPALSDAEIVDLVAFLDTLSDGYQP